MLQWLFTQWTTECHVVLIVGEFVFGRIKKFDSRARVGQMRVKSDQCDLKMLMFTVFWSLFSTLRDKSICKFKLLSNKLMFSFYFLVVYASLVLILFCWEKRAKFQPYKPSKTDQLGCVPPILLCDLTINSWLSDKQTDPRDSGYFLLYEEPVLSLACLKLKSLKR